MVSQSGRREHGRSTPISHLSRGRMGGGGNPSSLPTNIWSRWGSWPFGHKYGRVNPYPHQLKNSGEQAQHLARAAQLSQHCLCKCGRASPETVTMEELSPSPICLVAKQAGEKCSPCPHHPPINARGKWRNDPEVIRVGEPSITSSSCNTWESKPCTSPGKDNRVNTVCIGVGEPAWKL